ncbi:hypothetical protein GCM10012290_12300 [Halolactibacillus alkaliphilus]|uniref:ABC-2 type transporter transmembrane domain-containing protein n=1 Tax=Halolactibacillus alkaliphilus TaxID=442899 RepID=A0A511X0N2_9BACI|nr:ABC transporter permease [Halolactibacillus alkaliphilus]GEN56508.1 hypothetical protein HAL01_09720 [Halolactibacillus alkaliphilus]GGN69497.1 hypothetical protein GCM10012290_12300 [Halolactibacillus alkaliphilus]SFO74551.1 ABC-2 type transport system permease protein [Halolactibacillus alkaliphilus]
MNKFWVVLSQTYMTRFKSKSFIITTALFLVFILGLGNIDKIIDLFNSDEEVSEPIIAIIDETDVYGDYLENIESQSVQFNVATDSKEALNEAVLAGDIEGVLILTPDDLSPFNATLYLEDVLNNYIEYEVAEQL